ncbi:MAG: hypothetical protein C4562_00090 [Actinobacteria bacterium]|nr:MAG: hypothetical protein C4562_00090 [Actinomycetota bacterium]
MALFWPVTTQAAISLSPPSATVKAASDYATDTFADPWDMSNKEDVWSNYGNITGASFNNGEFSGTAINNDPQVWLLWGGYREAILTDRDGKQNPISTAKYGKVTFRMYSSAEGIGQLYWFYERDTSTNYQVAQFSVKAGWHVYSMDAHPYWTSLWTSSPISLRLDPVNVGGAQFSIDWIKATSNNSSTTSLGYTDDSPDESYSLFADSDTSNDFFQIDSAAAGTTSPHSFNLSSLAGGTYSLYLKSGSDISNPVTVTINNAPSVIITNPDVAGGRDWAQEVRRDPWDMSNHTDISAINSITSQGFNNGVYTAMNTSIRGSAIDDPFIYLNLSGKRINSSIYHRLTIRYLYSGTFDLVRGTMARLAWKNYPNYKGWQQSNDILTYDGWNNLTYDIRNLSLDVGSYGWRDSISALRFDPHEDPLQRRFYIDEVKVAADDELTNGSFDIKYNLSDADNAPVTLTLGVDRDTTYGNGNERTLHTSASSLGSLSYRFRPDTSFNGSYYIYALVSDGLNSNHSYSSGPLNIDTYKPKTYSRKTVARRVVNKRSVRRYQRIYRNYYRIYVRQRNKTLRRRYFKLYRRYLRAYRIARKGIARVAVKWYAKDPYVIGNEAYAVLRIKKRIKVAVRRSGRRTYKVVYRTVKSIRYGWTPINQWRKYVFATRDSGTYRYWVYAKDRAGNTQYNVATNWLVVR